MYYLDLIYMYPKVENFSLSICFLSLYHILYGNSDKEVSFDNCTKMFSYIKLKEPNKYEVSTVTLNFHN